MRRLLLFVLALLGMALACGATSAVADSSSGMGGFSAWNPGGSALAGAAPTAPDPNGDVTCSGDPDMPAFAPAIVPHDLIVPPGRGCIAGDGTTIGHDVLVKPGARLGTGGITVGHDVVGDHPDVIEIGDFARGSGRSAIGHDVNVNGGSSDNFLQEVCNAAVAHSVIWQNVAASAALSVGDQDFLCFTGTVHVGQDGIFRNNQGVFLEISDNNPANGGGGFGHNLIVQNNASTVVESNAIGQDCLQQNNHPYTNDDGDSTGPNTAGHSIGGCNTPNS